MFNLRYILAFSFLLINLDGMTRELNYQEKLSLLPYTKTKKVMGYMVEKIDNRSLSIPDYLSYGIMKKACVPLDKLVEKIKSEEEDYQDQSKKITTLYSVCAESTLGLTSLYIQQNPLD